MKELHGRAELELVLNQTLVGHCVVLLLVFQTKMLELINAEITNFRCL
jgi:hypothetical protein